MIALVDYLVYTVKGVHSPISFRNTLFGDSLEWYSGTPKNGYTDCCYASSINFYWRSIFEGNEVCVWMSGQGCRSFEILMGDDFQWHQHLKGLLEKYPSIHFSRIDIALDVTEDWVPSTKAICGYVERRQYVSKFRRDPDYTPGFTQESIYFGAKSSDKRLRIYNKSMERGKDEHWIRFEYQLRNDYASGFVKEYIAHQDVGYTLRSCMNRDLRFTTKPNVGDRHQDRLKTVQWWERMMIGAGEIRLFTVPPPDYNMHKLEMFLLRQVSASLATYFDCNSGDISSILRLIEYGRENYKDKHLDLIQDVEIRRKMSDRYGGDIDWIT